MRMLALVAVAAWTSASTMSLAAQSVATQQPQGDECVCKASYNPASPSVGILVSSTGSVYFAGEKGFQALPQGSGVPANTWIRTGPDSSADFQFGDNCQTSIGANGLVNVVPSGKTLCVQTIEPQVAQVSGTGWLNGNTGLILAAVAAAAVGGAVFYFSMGQEPEENGVSD